MADGDNAFPRSRRLVKAEEFRRVFERPERSADRFFTVLARPNGLHRSRLGLAISKKSLRRAVDRNRVKRLIRESFRQRRDSTQGLDMVVMCRPVVAEADNRALRRSLDGHWNRLSQRCAKP